MTCPKRPAEKARPKKEKEEEVKHEASLKELFQGETLNGYVEAARSRTLDTFMPKGRLVDEEKK